LREVARVPKALLREGEPHRVTYPPFDIVVVHKEGAYFALEDACNHAGASLAEGDVDEGGRIRCPVHGYLFDLATGRLLAPRGLCADQRTFVVREVGDEVVVYEADRVVLLG
jgi:nitrite reductase/ring-hydroxylating ferredoxin subunit